PADTVLLDLGTGELAPPDPGVRRALRVVRQNYQGRSTLAWSVDLARGVVGATPIAFVEKGVFGVEDFVRRSFSRLFGWSADSRLKKEAAPPVARVLTVAEETGTDSGWPPPPIPSLWEAGKPGEGQWSPVTHPFLPKL